MIECEGGEREREQYGGLGVNLLDLPPLELSCSVLFCLVGWCDCLVVVRGGPSWIPGTFLGG